MNNQFTLHLQKIILILSVFTIVFSYEGCKSKSDKTIFKTEPVSIKTRDFPVGPDPSVSPENGGKGFTGDGWTTGSDYHSISSRNSVKGGSVTLYTPFLPATTRPYGKDGNIYTELIRNLFYESLIDFDPVTLSVTPLLATHWLLMDDSITFKFRINPDARWADGYPVTSGDVIATWKLLSDRGLMSPYENLIADHFEQPEAESEYIVAIRAKKYDWRNINFIAFMKILPERYVGGITGNEFLDKYRYSFIPGSGPYLILDKEAEKDKSFVIRRRKDFWGENLISSTGKYNFDEIRIIKAENDILNIEKINKGESDAILVFRNSVWKNDFSADKINRGIILKKQIYNNIPYNVQGICLNSRIKPLDDVRIRKALSYALDRKKMNERLFDTSYIYLHSYFPGTDYENTANPRIGFNLDSAAYLLTQAGWTGKNKEGYLTKNDKILEIDFTFTKGMDRYLTIYQEDLRKIGVKLNLKETDPVTAAKLLNDRTFFMQIVNFSRPDTPNPESEFSSSLADSYNSANWSGIKNPEIDKYILLYNNEPDRTKRTEYIRSIDSLLCDYAGFVLMWTSPCSRIVFQNKFGYPECMFGRYAGFESVFSYWYLDPQKTEMYSKALESKDMILDKGNQEIRYWENYSISSMTGK